MYWTTFRIPYGISHYTRNKDCGTQRALRTLPVGGFQQEHVFLSARHLLSKYTTKPLTGFGSFTAAKYGTRCPAHEYGTPPSMSCRIHAPGISFHMLQP